MMKFLEIIFSPEGFIAAAIALGVLRGVYKGVSHDD